MRVNHAAELFATCVEQRENCRLKISRLLSIPCLPEPISVTNVIFELLSNAYKNKKKIACQHSKLWLGVAIFSGPKSSTVIVRLRLVSQYVYTRLTFRHRASCILGQAFRCSPENAFYIFNQQIYFII